MDLLLKLAVNLIEHFEADQLIANFELIAILEHGLIDRFAVKDGSVGRVEVLQSITYQTGGGVGLSDNPSVQARGARVIDTYICIKRPAQSYVCSLQRNLHRQQFAAQEDER